MTAAVLNIIEKRFPFVEISNENECKILRSTVSNEEEAHELINIISSYTKSDWIVYRNLKSPKRCLFHKKWVCQHNERHKLPKEVSIRNTECTAFIDILIKKISKDTRYRDEFLKMTVPMPAIIKIKLEHNHPLGTANSMKLLRVSDEVKDVFYQYFSDGYTPAEAASYHKSTILEEMSSESLSDSKVCPTERQISYLFNIWKEENLGTSIDPFQKLMDKSKIYENAGTSIYLDLGPEFAILVVTPVMKRAHKLVSASEIVFVDSTASVESGKSTLTIILIGTKAGAIPIGVFIHEKQTALNYEKAFRLLQNKYPKCFGGKEAPMVFMTDDSAAEKSSLSAVWPNARQLLCHFHVAQAMWRWLFTNIDKNDRQFLMKLFQNVMYAKTEDDANAAVASIINLDEKYSAFVNRCVKFLERKTEWMLLHRLNLITRNHNTNNFAEASIRVLKDNVLQRVKAYNIVALCDYLVSIFDKYLVKRLLEYAYNRNQKGKIIYKSFSEQIDVSLSDKIIAISDKIFCVPSTTENKYYEVHADVGVCSCLSGLTGAFCKHQWLLADAKKIHLPNMPLSTADDRYFIGLLALDDKCPPRRFFGDFKEVTTDASKNMEDSNSPHITIDQMPSTSQEIINEQRSKFASTSYKEKILEQMENLLQNDIPLSTAHHIENFMKNIKLRLSGKRPNRTGKKIKVQPTSISRRRPGISRGNCKLPQGRPNSKTNFSFYKRKRYLSSNIRLNQNNPK